MPLGPEDLQHKQFANTIKHYKALNKLNCCFWSYSPSGEKRNAITGSLLKAKGLTKGIPDFEFRLLKDKIMQHIYIEFKYGKNKQSPEQVYFQKTCDESINDNYYLAYSVDDAINILIDNGVILK